MANGGDPSDGAAVSDLMLNRSYNILGQDIFMNADGDRRSEFELRQLGSDGTFHVRNLYRQDNLTTKNKYSRLDLGDAGVQLHYAVLD